MDSKYKNENNKIVDKSLDCGDAIGLSYLDRKFSVGVVKIVVAVLLAAAAGTGYLIYLQM